MFATNLQAFLADAGDTNTNHYKTKPVCGQNIKKYKIIPRISKEKQGIKNILKQRKGELNTPKAVVIKFWVVAVLLQDAIMGN
jgi:hypothetical protein